MGATGVGPHRVIEARLTEAQEGLWLARRLDPDNPCQNTGKLLRFTGPLDADRIAETVDAVLAEADGLNVRVDPESSPARMTSEGLEPLRTRRVELRGESDPLRIARAAVHADMGTPRDPAGDPMVTSVLYTLGDDDHLWYLSIQHLVIDGYGTTLLLTRVLDLLAAAVADRPPRTRPFAPFAGVLAEDAEYRDSARRADDRAWWHDTLARLGEVESFERGEPLAAPFHHRARRSFPESLRLALDTLARSVGCSWPDALAAGIGVYVGRHIATPPVLGVPLMNRLGSATARVPCTTMNVVPVAVASTETDTPAEVVARVGEAMRGARAHGRFRTEVLRRDLGRVGAGRRLFGPLVNVLPFQRLPVIEGVETTFEVLGAGPVDDITFTVRGGRAAEGLALEVDANPRLHDLTGTETHADRLLDFLHRFAALDGPLAELQTLGEAEFTRWVHGVNDTAHPVPDTTLVELFRRRAEATPAHPALIGEHRLDYGRTLAEVVRFAGRLRAAGVGRGAVVAVHAERSVERVIAYLAVMWLGAAYLPIDPEHPVERSRRICDSAAPVGVVTRDPDAAGALGVPSLGWPLPGRPTVDEPDAERPSARPDAGRARPEADDTRPDARPDARPDDPAYVLYTSGSTGAPKGVVIEHRAIVNRLEWMRETFDIGADDRILQKTPATFDVSVWELFLPFLAGATLVVAPPGVHRDPTRLARIVRDESISALHFVPAMLGPFLDDPESEGLRIARVFTSGERLEAPLRDRFHRRIEGRLHNLYGPTEAAVDVTHWPAPADDRSDPVPIGRPVWNTRAYVLDAEGRPTPPGVAGELYLAGRQLAREYLGRPDLTAERFVPDPFHPGERMYRTGDRARWRRDGVLLFDGRLDRQVKVRGQRIELGEVEAGLMALDGVADAVVALPRDAAPGAGLVAWVTAEGGRALDPDSLREDLARRLPEAMVPAAILVLDAFPLTASGKTDHRALPDPPAPTPSDGGAPRTDTERRVAELFARALGLAGTPGPADDFFRLGGHSLAAIEVLAGLREATGVTLGPGALFATPTVGALAGAIDAAARSAAGAGERAPPSEESTGLAPLLPLADGPEGTAPGSSAGTLYCIHPAGGIAWCYAALARELGGAVRMVGVQSPWLAPSAVAPPEPTALDDLARRYLDTVLAAHPGGPIHLLGWSVGGIIAHAMAHHMAQRGLRVGCLALLDAYPADYWHDQPDPDADAPLRALLLIAGEDPDRFGGAALDRAAVRGVLRERRHLLGSLSDEALDGVVRVVGLNNRLVRTHRHPRLEADVIHFRAALDHAGTDIDPRSWSPYVAAMESHPIPAIHPHMTGPAASARVAEVLAGRLAAGSSGVSSTGAGR
ncbi:amino acid adenylation domain-containing protein [Gaopeijia maritima]|uniref:amino acid adenylation domain-containing protein n=1 Tax=Gaopeijia maritima TaxID=3119007 RepID=UPI0038644BB6